MYWRMTRFFFLPPAMEWLEVKQGDPLQLRVGTQTLTLRVAGGLRRARAGQRLGSDGHRLCPVAFSSAWAIIAHRAETDARDRSEAFKAALEQQLETRGQYIITETADQEVRVANMSRAYRVNLNVLGMVALFTGTFLVFSTQALSVVRRRHQFALLRVLGLTRSQLLGQVLFEGNSSRCHRLARQDLPWAMRPRPEP